MAQAWLVDNERERGGERERDTAQAARYMQPLASVVRVGRIWRQLLPRDRKVGLAKTWDSWLILGLNSFITAPTSRLCNPGAIAGDVAGATVHSGATKAAEEEEKKATMPFSQRTGSPKESTRTRPSVPLALLKSRPSCNCTKLSLTTTLRPFLLQHTYTLLMLSSRCRCVLRRRLAVPFPSRPCARSRLASNIWSSSPCTPS